VLPSSSLKPKTIKALVYQIIKMLTQPPYCFYLTHYIYIYAFIYVGYTEKQYIEKQDALSAVSCSLREMERVTAMNRLLY